jgi:hypothetical protein
LNAQLVNDWKVIEGAVAAKGADGALGDPAVQQVAARFRVLPGLSKPALGYSMVLDGERPAKDYRNRAELESLIAPAGRPLGGLDMQAIWGGNSMFGSADIKLDDVLLDGWFPHGNQSQLEAYVNKHYDEVMGRQEEYDLNRYYQHHDFRIAIGLNYLVSLAKAMGVTSNIEPVQSFPLGTNVVSLAEVAKIYQTFVSGKTYRFYQEGAPNQLNLIRRIEDRFGNTLFEPKRAEYQLVLPEFGLQMREILRRVITHGTGRRAMAELYLTLNPADPGKQPDPKKAAAAEKRIRIPAFGKTGTTNDYNNANFAGFLPYPVEKGAPLDPENSYVLAAYAGYDVNVQMRAGAINVTGAIGALPAWIGLAKAIIDKKKYADQLDQLDLSLISRQEWPLKADERATALTVDLPRGVVMGGNGGEGEAVATSDSSKEGESASDEFRPNSVQAVLHMPLEQGGAPLREFSPYKLEDQMKALALPTKPVAGGAWRRPAPRSPRKAATAPPPTPVPSPGTCATTTATAIAIPCLRATTTPRRWPPPPMGTGSIRAIRPLLLRFPRRRPRAISRARPQVPPPSRWTS